MSEHQRWYSIDVERARFFLAGEWLDKGTTLGLSLADGRPVLAEESGQVVSIQYDVGQQKLIVVLDSGSRPDDRARARSLRNVAARGRRKAIPSRQTKRRDEALRLAGGSIR